MYYVNFVDRYMVELVNTTPSISADTDMEGRTLLKVLSLYYMCIKVIDYIITQKPTGWWVVVN